MGVILGEFGVKKRGRCSNSKMVEKMPLKPMDREASEDNLTIDPAQAQLVEFMRQVKQEHLNLQIEYQRKMEEIKAETLALCNQLSDMMEGGKEEGVSASIQLP